MSYLKRQERWIRGDYQILGWLKSKTLNKLSKFKILDNIRRSLLEVIVIFNLGLLLLLKLFNSNSKIGLISSLLIISIIISSILEMLNYIIFRKENIKKQKKFSKSIDGLEASFYRAVINIITLPTKAYVALIAMAKAIYRMYISKEKLLEWTTSEEAEKLNKNSLVNVLKKMMPNIILGLVFIVISKLLKTHFICKLLINILSLAFLIAPIIMYYISKEKINVPKVNKLSKQEISYIKKIAEETWGYFAEFMNKENSYLPPDNYQESRREKIIDRTSATNIGLGILAILSAYDLNFINLEETIEKLENSLQTIIKLEKWNGHLYNWYNTKTLKPLMPKYISTVDSRKLCADICIH